MCGRYPASTFFCPSAGLVAGNPPRSQYDVQLSRLEVTVPYLVQCVLARRLAYEYDLKAFLHWMGHTYGSQATGSGRSHLSGAGHAWGHVPVSTTEWYLRGPERQFQSVPTPLSGGVVAD